MEKSLSLSEKLYFLSIKREKGGISMSVSSQIHLVLHGAILIEMLHKAIIKVEDHRIILQRTTSENEIYSYILDLFKGYSSTKRVRFWISRMSMKRARIKRLIHSQMENKRLISIEKKHFLFFKWDKPHILNYKLHRELNKVVSSAIFSNESNNDELILMILIKSLNSLKNIFQDKDNRKQARRMLKALVVNPPITQEEKEIVIDINRAIRAAHAAAAAGA